MNSPYQNSSLIKFWKSAVSSKTISTIDCLYKPKFKIGKNEKVVTLGSCFAQHIASNMRAKGYTVIDTEPPPPGLKGVQAKRFGYELFSARVGNVYVMRQLLQLYEESKGLWKPHEIAWEKNGRFYDAMRPSVEPGGLDSPESVKLHREKHLSTLSKMFSEADVIIFTLGLTECWMNKEYGDVYPTAPGTIAGSYSSNKYVFKNFTFMEIYNDFIKFMKYIKSINPNIKFLLTVSPVPLTATASVDHVLTATTYSKSVLRAVAGQLAKEFDCIDYFPSYDIITSILAGGKLYQSNLRSVTSEGVALAMNTFFLANGDSVEPKETESFRENDQLKSINIEDEFCEDVLLEAFGK